MARKINTNFILIVMLVVGCGVAGVGGLWYYRRHHRDPKQLLVQAQKSEAEGALKVAADHYMAAGQLMRDPKLITKAGDLYNQLTYEDELNLRNAQQAWALAVATDPTAVPALERQLSSTQEYVRVLMREKPAPQMFDSIHETAAKLLKVDPKNLAARAAGPMATIDAWMGRVETDQNQVDAAIKELIELQKDDPKNPEIPFYIAA